MHFYAYIILLSEISICTLSVMPLFTFCFVSALYLLSHLSLYIISLSEISAYTLSFICIFGTYLHRTSTTAFRCSDSMV